MGDHLYRETLGEIFADRIELDGLMMIANKQAIIDHSHAQVKAGITAVNDYIARMSEPQSTPMAAMANGTATIQATSPQEEADAGSFINRSPVTNYHLYPQAPATVAPVPPVVSPTPTPAPPATPGKGISPWWALAAIPLLMAGGLAWYLWPKPAPVVTPTPAPAPVPVVPPPNWTADPTIILRDWPVAP